MNPTRRPLSQLEIRLAEQLVHTRLHATTLTIFGELDCTALNDLHDQVADAFRMKYGSDLGLTPFLVKAAARGLSHVPCLMNRIEGDECVTAATADIAVEIAGASGRFQPVVRDCGHLAIPDLAAALRDLSDKAEAGTLTLPELQGGVMTLMCYGPDGHDNSTPALSAPQSAALAIHPVRQRPAARDGEIAIRPMARIALSYDARIIPTADAAAFLSAFCQALQSPVGLLLDT